ncbi:MAG: hypothetical protein JWM64_943 [Frankiales bacterium]|nr:hypothetical protein [Frankiales bacterium]
MTSPLELGGRSLWFAGQFVQLCLAQALAAVVLAVAAFGSSHSSSLSTQLNWIVLAIAGLAIALAPNLSWLLVGRRRIGLRRAQLAVDVDARFAPRATTAPDEESRLVTALNMSHYHRSGCQLVRGKATHAADLPSHLSAALTPCGVCRP